MNGRLKDLKLKVEGPKICRLSFKKKCTEKKKRKTSFFSFIYDLYRTYGVNGTDLQFLFYLVGRIEYPVGASC